MADPRVKLTVDADGVVREGTLQPDVGAAIEVQFSSAAKSEFGIDYTHPDSFKLHASGSFKFKLGGGGKVGLSGSLTESLLDGTTTFKGTFTWDFPKNVSVKVTTQLGDKEKKVGAHMTIQF